jgi:hypothetical protein
MSQDGEKGSMKATGSADPKVGKDHNDPNKDSQGQDENQVEEKDPPTDAALKEGQKEVVDHPQDEIEEVGDPRSETGDDFHSDENRQKRYQRLADATHVVWRKADDILTISQAEIQVVEPPRVSIHDERIYTNGNLLRIISEEKCVKGVEGMSEDWMVRQQGVPLWNKLRWAITEGIKIYEYACENHQDMMDRAEELIASVGEEYRVTVRRRLKKGWQEREIPKTWRPVLDVWHEQEEKLKAAAAAREKRNKKKEKKDKRKRLEAEEENEEVPAQEPGVTGNATDVQSPKMQESVIAEGTTHAGRPDPQDRELRVMRRQSHKLNKERKQSAEEAEEGAGADTGKARLESEELKRLVEAEESEGGKDAAAAKYLIKVTGYSEEACAELIRMEKVPGVSTIQAYHRAVNELNQAQQEHYRALEPGAAAGTATYSGSGTGAGSGSGKPVYSAEFAAEMEAGPERPEDERETRKNKREVQRAQALEADEVKKEKKKKEAESKAGPSRDPRNVQAEKEERALASMCTLTGRSEEQCAQALAIQSEPGREFLEVYHRACHMLLEDGDPSKEGYANLVKGFQG